MRGMIASALTGLGALIIGLVVIYLTPRTRRGPPRPTDVEALRLRNAELERRVVDLEARLDAIGTGGRQGGQ